MKVQTHGEIPEKRYNHASALCGTQLVIFGGINGNTYTNSNIYICEMEHLKALKQIMNNGKKRACFEETLEDKAITKYSMKRSKKDKGKDLISIFQNKKVSAPMTPIEILEKKIKEAISNGSSEYQINVLKDELKNEILAEKCKMIENTETLSELSRTIDEIDNRKSYYGHTRNNFNSISKIK